METRANYALIGAFTLAMIAAAFFFVLWFSGGSKNVGLKTYEIIFTGSVSGLSRGSQVLFNGLHVGDVQQIDLMREDPSRVAALVTINERTPIKTDTKARLEFAGLTGVASIALTGGSATAPAILAPEDGRPPVIFAERSDLQNLLESVQNLSTKADSVLAKADKILGDSSGSIQASVKNVETFTQALSDNKDGVNSFLKGVGDLGATIGPLSTKLGTLSTDIDGLVKAVDAEKVKSIVANADKLLSDNQESVKATLKNVEGFSQALADNKAGLDSFLKGAGELGPTLGTLSTKLSAVSSDIEGVVKSIDAEKVKKILANVDTFTNGLSDNKSSIDAIMKNAQELTAKLNTTADKLDGVLSGVDGFLSSAEKKGVFENVSEAAVSIRRLADNLDKRTAEMAAGINRFTGPGLRDLEALTGDARKSINEVNRSLRSLQVNPQQFLFGARPALPDYKGN